MTKIAPNDPMHHFVPQAVDQRQLRDAFARFATGVTIVTVASQSGPIAITANSFSSISLDPPLVLWAPQKASRRFPFFVDAAHYAIHILAADQDDLCWRVAKDMHGLVNEDLELSQDGVPLIAGCLARFECARAAVHDGGDHKIIVGQVLRASLREDGDALGFYKGKMTRVSAS